MGLGVGSVTIAPSPSPIRGTQSGDQVLAITGQKRVVRIDVADIGVPLQTTLQRSTALLPKGLGKGLAKRAAERRQNLDWERR